MDPINSWVDATEVRRLAESLVLPVPDARRLPAETYGEDFVGFAGRDAGARPAGRRARDETLLVCCVGFFLDFRGSRAGW